MHDLSVKGEFVFSFLSFGVKIRFKPPLNIEKRRAGAIIGLMSAKERELHIHATTLMLSISPSQHRLRRSLSHIKKRRKFSLLFTLVIIGQNL